MNAVRYRVGRRLRAERDGLVRLALIVAVVSGIVLAIAAGAHRTATAPDRYVASTPSPYDALISQYYGAPRTAEIARLPQIASASGATFVFAGFVPPGSDEPAELNVFAGELRAFGFELVEGREADPSRPDEFVITRSASEATALGVGDTVQLVTYLQETVERSGFDAPPDGPTFPATVVGIGDGTADGDPTARAGGNAIFSTALLDVGDIGTALTLVFVDLESGVDLAALRDALDTLPEPDTLTLEPVTPLDPSVRRSVDTVGRGLWILAAVAAMAGLAALGQMTSRELRVADDESRALAALGYQSRQLRRECLLVGTFPVAGGVLVGSLVAVGCSGIFPVGFSRGVEPDRGIRVDVAVLLPGIAVLVTCVLLWVVAALLVAPRDPVRRTGTGGSFGRALVAWPDVASAVGMRFAYWRARGDAGAVRAAAVGLSATLLGLTGAAVVASSLDRLVHDREAFGYFYDMRFDTGQQEIADELLTSVSDDPDVGAITTLSSALARAGADTVQVVGFETVRGSVRPAISEGRLPDSSDEAAVGREQARRLGVDVGDTFELDGVTGRASFAVVGIVVVPPLGGNDGVGEDVLVTMQGLRRLAPDAVAQYLVADTRPGAPPGSAVRIMTTYSPGSVDDSRPVVVENLDRVRFVPLVLAAFLLLLAVLTAVHALTTATRNRRRDYAVLGSMGATRRWARRVAVSHATVFVLVPLLIALPGGVVAGSVVFRLMARSVGTLDTTSVPFATMAVTAALLLVAIAAAALGAAHRIISARPGRLLRTE